MREILFRGKSVTDGRWVFGDLSNYGDYRAITTTRGFSIIDSCEVIPETVGQYTGLTDKRGKKIFEGDILRESAKNGWEKKNFVGFEVFWHDNDSCDRHIGWQMNRLHFYGSLSGADIYPIAFRPEWTRRMEVIGNIYDNPELMGGEAHG